MNPQIDSVRVEGDTLVERSTDAALMVLLFAAKAAVALSVTALSF